MTCVQPVIRAMQKARETSGKWKEVDASGFTLYHTQETSNLRPTFTPKMFIRYQGSNYTNPT